jgi:hypothetical protein
MVSDKEPHADVSAGPPAILAQLRELVTDALRYWELRRLFYKALLALVVLGHFITSWPASKTALTSDGALGLFLLAVLANVAYSVVYIPDVFIQFSGFRRSRARWRLVFLVVGFAFAAVLTHFVSGGAFSGSSSAVL